MGSESKTLIVSPTEKKEPALLTLSPFEDLPSRSIQTSIRYKLFNLLENPNSSLSALLVNVVIISAILLSTALVVVQSLPQFHTGRIALLWGLLEVAIVIILTTEFILRVYAWCDTDIHQIVGFLKSPMAIIDILSFVPSYLEFVFYLFEGRSEIVEQFAIFKVMRLFRLLRLFRYSAKMQLLFIAVRNSTEVLIAIFFFLLLATVVSSTLMYYAERGIYNPDKQNYFRADGLSPFNSIPASMWWSISVLTTIGLAETFAPITPFGKIMAGSVMLLGVLVIALPSLIISTAYKEACDKYDRERKITEEENAIETHGQLLEQFSETDGLILKMERQIKALEKKQDETKKIYLALVENLQQFKAASKREVRTSDNHQTL